MNIVKPSIFVVGAPKCGTTTIVDWLDQHPNIFMPALKEPHYFSTDLNYSKKLGIKKSSDYEGLFKNLPKYINVVGEGSTSYLYSNNAIDNIIRYNKNASFVVMLRNPVEMVLSLHAQKFNEMKENESDIMRAWALQEQRRNGIGMSIHCEDRSELLYKDWCSLGTQVKRMMSKIDKDKCHIIWLEDMKVDSVHIYNRLIDFIGLKNYDIDTRVKNRRRCVRYRWLEPSISHIANIKKRLGIKYSFGFNRLNTKEYIKERKCKYIYEFLTDEMSDEISLLESITGRSINNN